MSKDNFDMEDVEGLTVKRLPRVMSRFNIKLTERFYAKSQQDQQKYLHELASTMNHALDIMQKERDEVIGICNAQEAQIIKLAEQSNKLAEQIQAQITAANAKAQQRAQEILDLRAELRDARER